MQEGIKEVDGKEAQVCQPLQQPFHAGVSDLGNLAGVERLAEANVNIVFMETRIRSDEDHTAKQPYEPKPLLGKAMKWGKCGVGLETIFMSRGGGAPKKHFYQQPTFIKHTHNK